MKLMQKAQQTDTFLLALLIESYDIPEMLDTINFSAIRSIL